jgi:CheY-like chemotaxis protein
VVAFAIGKGQFATLALDVSEQKRAEEALRSADRNKNEFLALLSHELRNPLAPIRNSLHVLGRVPPDSPQAQRALRVVERQAEQLSSIVEDLLDVTRISRGKIELRRGPLDLGQLLRQGVDDAQSSLAAGGLALVVDIAEEPLCVEGDPVRLAQVVGNLLQNAAKFTPQGGSVFVSLRREGERAALRVRDSGIGMERRTLERLFQPFVQADVGLDRTNAGLGLGLSLVKSLVELHGGSVAATSEGRNKGSEFLVTLPLANVPAQPPHARAEAGRRARRRVLVIEDNADAGDSLCEVLALGGHEVELARAGAEGLEKARARRPDLVLCDIGLPDLSGHEVAAAFRSDPRLRSVRLVALSGYALPDDVARAAAAGFDDHLAKPPSIEQLHEILGSLAASGDGSRGSGSAARGEPPSDT